ncbi:hypothetical protein P886_3332 [Alteromonadaceae bacterium 2753L.S.0a.02]|nr:hypothetical protein P886_3332 [Alteromonadaceae bacterium 2753L.S.0a.02]
MGLLDIFLGSDLNLKRPNFRYAPTVELSLGKCSLKFKNPDHSAMYPINVFPESFDLYDLGNYDPNGTGDYYKVFYERGWQLFGKSKKSRGGVGVVGNIFYFTEEFQKRINFKEIECFHDLLLFLCNDFWKSRTRNPEEITSEYSAFRYPIKHDDFTVTHINQTAWTSFTAGASGKPPNIGYATPLTKNHILYFEFKLEAFQSLDFYSPETNLKECSFSIVDEFISNVEISQS